MKKLISLLTVGTMLVSMATPALAHYNASKVADVPKVSNDSITIDGMMSDAVWADAAKIEIDQFNAGVENNTRGTAHLLWGDDTLYVYCDVKDADVIPPSEEIQKNQPWNTDSVEMYFDFGNEHKNLVQQFRIDVGGWLSYYVERGEMSVYGPNAKQYFGDYKVTMDSDGYNIEAAINLEQWGLEDRDAIGLNLMINDMTSADKKNTTAVWKMSQSKGAMTWEGDLYDYIVLSPGEVEIVDRGSCSENITWTLDSTGLLTVSGSGNMPGYNYTDFWSSGSVKYVIIEDGITGIGYKAFSDCTELTTIEIPNSVTSIGDSAFYGCSGLMSITIPNSITNIGKSAFHNCTALTSITIPDSVETICDSAFYGCTGLTTIEIPAGVKRIYGSAFSGCSNLKTATFMGDVPDTFDIDVFLGTASDFKIYYYEGAADWTYPTWTAPDGTVFNTVMIASEEPEAEIVASGECGDNLTWTLDADGVLTVSGEGDMDAMGGKEGPSAPWYQYSKDIRELVLENGITSIGLYAFFGLGNITEINIPSSVKNIEYAAFWNCQLAELTIPSGVISINEEAFNCPTLKTVHISDTVQNIHSRAFGVHDTCFTIDENNPYYTAEKTAIYNKDKTELWCNTSTLEGDFYVADSVTKIKSMALTNCRFDTLYLPASIYLIETAAFWKCTNLKNVYFAGDAPKAITVADFTDTADNITFYYYEGAKDWTSPTWTDANGTTVKTVMLETPAEKDNVCGENLTYSLSSDGVLTISGTGKMYEYDHPTNDYYSDRDPAPWHKQSVKKVVIENGVTSIGDFAFYGCDLSNGITIASTVKTIGAQAFADALFSEIVIPEGVEELSGDNVFSGNHNLKSISLPSTLKKLSGQTFNFGSWGDVDYTLNENNPYFVMIDHCIYNKAVTELVYCCESECEITLPETVTKICDFAIRHGGKLTNANSNTVIGDFNEFTDEITMTIPDGVTAIGSWTEMGNRKTQTLILPASLKSIGQCSFDSMMALTSLYFKGDAPTLDSYASGTSSAFLCTAPFVTVFYHEGAEGFNIVDGKWTTSQGVNVNAVAIPAGVEFKPIVHVPAVEPTYESEGNVEYWYCAIRDKYYADAACTEELESVTIDRLPEPVIPSEPTVPTERLKVDVVYATPEIDGVLKTGEWNYDNAAIINADNAVAWAGDVISDAVMYYAWDDNGLYIAGDLKDTDICLAPSIEEVYTLDAMQIALDPAGLIGKADLGGAMFYSIGPMEDGKLGAVYHPYGGAAEAFEYTGSYSLTDDGWQFEMMIPWTSIEILAEDGYAWNHAENEVINALVCVLDRDEDGAVVNCYQTSISGSPDFSPMNYPYALKLKPQTSDKDPLGRGLVYSAPTATPVIDGIMDESWAVAEWTQIDLPYDGSLDSVCAARAKILHDDGLLYFLVEVTDATPAVGESLDITARDQFEIYIDEDCCRDVAYCNYCYQLALTLDGSVREGTNAGGLSDIIKKYVVGTNDDGYVLEFSVDLLKGIPADDRAIGLEFMYADSAEDGTFLEALRWNADTAGGDTPPWQAPEYFGTLKCLTSDTPSEPTPDAPEADYEDKDPLGRGLVYSAHTATPKVDGVVDDAWAAAEWTKVDLPYAAAGKQSDCSARAKVLHDDDMLYFLVETIDTTPSDEDCVDIYLDEDICQAHAYCDVTTQLTFRLTGKVTKGSNSFGDIDMVKEYVVTKTDNGYIFEIAIEPLNGIPTGGIGMEFMYGDFNENGYFLDALRWNADTAAGNIAPWQAPENFGKLICLHEKPVEIPVTESKDTVSVEVKDAVIHGSTITVKDVDVESLESVFDAPAEETAAPVTTVTIDVSNVTREGSEEAEKVQQVTVPAAVVDTIKAAAEKNDVEDAKLAVHLTTGSIILDKKTMDVIAEKTAAVDENKTTTVSLVIDDAEDNLNEAQETALENEVVFAKLDIYMEVTTTDQNDSSNTTTEKIHDFEGGIVQLEVPFEIPEGMKANGFTVYYLDDDGVLHPMDTQYVNGKITWTTGHFSDYIILYNEIVEEETPADPVPEAPRDPIIIDVDKIVDNIREKLTNIGNQTQKLAEDTGNQIIDRVKTMAIDCVKNAINGLAREWNVDLHALENNLKHIRAMMP